MITPRPNPRRPAFTLIEVIVVVVMLAILAGIVVPRMAGSERRLAEAQAHQIASMLSIVGWRAAVAPETMEIEFDPVSDSIRLLVNRAGPANPRGPADRSLHAWRQDPLVTPVVLDRLVVAEAWSGTQRAESSGASRPGARSSAGAGGAWRIDIPVDRPREPIVLILADKIRTKDSVSYRVELATGRTSARLTTGDAPPAADPDRELDLDALGLEEHSW
jgi:prepilin-type N-terminal cleavage/methylation domain-containing protein